MSDVLWLVWSNEHRGFWRADRRGYTTSNLEAGRFSTGEARLILANAAAAGPIEHDGVALPQEIMLPAPDLEPTPDADWLADMALVHNAPEDPIKAISLRLMIAETIRYDRERR